MLNNKLLKKPFLTKKIDLIFGLLPVLFFSTYLTACANKDDVATEQVKTDKIEDTVTTKQINNVFAEKPQLQEKPTVSQLSQEESDDKLDQVAQLQGGEDIEVKNKPSETHLYESVHYQQKLYKQILGVWQGVKDTEQLKMMGLDDEQIKQSKVEIGFMPDHDMQMRTVGLPAPEDTPFIKTKENGVTVMTGRYIIKEDQIVIYFGRDAMENQYISIDKDTLTLSPISDKSMKLRYKKKSGWSLQEK